MEKFVYDLHVHTSQTSHCGHVDAVEIPHLYKSKGYSGLVITDHYYANYFESMGKISWDKKIDNFLTGYRIASAEGKKIDFDILLGMEITFLENMNDYLIYGIDEEFLLNYPALFDYGLEGFRDLAWEKGLLIYQAHPFRRHIIPADPSLLDGVEVFNGNGRHDSRNELALEFAETNNLKMISGSDFHQYEDLAVGGIVLPQRVESVKTLVKLLASSSPELYRNSK